MAEKKEETVQSVHTYDKNDEWVMGIDEAGRGPVLGPMLYGACICPQNKLDDLKKTGVFDSKQLTDEKRRELFKMIKKCKYLQYVVDAIPADWISESMIQQNRYSLNEISHDSAINLIQITIDSGYKLTQVYLDTVGMPEKYEQKLRNHFMGYDIRFTVSKKADALYPVVSAASICAKVTRDDILQNWYWIENNLKHLNNDSNNDMKEEKEGKENLKEYWLGNGYPGHEKTKQFMKDYIDTIFGYPSIVRFSWQTAKILIEKHCAKVTFSDETATNNLKKWGFGGGGKVKRTKFYKDANLNVCFENPF